MVLVSLKFVISKGRGLLGKAGTRTNALIHMREERLGASELVVTCQTTGHDVGSKQRRSCAEPSKTMEMYHLASHG
jgi:hypothetical protein